MVIDFHAHIVPPSFRADRERYAAKDATFSTLFSHPRARLAGAEELVAAMDRDGVDRALVMGVGWTDPTVAREANDYIIESVDRFSPRLVGLCSINPAWGEDALKEVERCAGHGIKGIGELHPDTQGFDITSKASLEPLMNSARRLGLLVLTHSSEPVGHLYPGKGHTTPDRLYSLIRNFPDNTIVCAHWGGGLPFYMLMPELAEELKKVYFDTAASPLLYTADIYSTAVEVAGADRLLFGSDYPLVSHRRLIQQIQDAPISQDAREKILGENALSLLKL